MISFKENGERIESVNEIPAFYGLVLDEVIVEYFGTIEALKLAVTRLEAESETIEFELAA